MLFRSACRYSRPPQRNYPRSGSEIGPLLFISYINELAVISAAHNVTVKLLAVDVKLYAEISTDVDVADLTHALSCIAEWADTWQLQSADLCY